MTGVSDEELLDIACEAAMDVADMDVPLRTYIRAALAAVMPDVVAAERERAAVVCETLEWGKDVSWWLHATKKDVAAEAGHQCAAAIRARGDA